MHRSDDPRRFRADPVRRYALGRSFLVWCESATLTGTVVWGRITEADLGTLIGWWALEDQLADGFDAVIDLTRLDAIDPAVFQLLAGYVRGLAPRYGRRMRRQAIAHGAGFTGAVVAGFYATQDAPYAWQVFPSAAPAFAWLERPDAAAAQAEVEAILAREVATAPEIRALRAWLRDHLIEPTIDLAAVALTTSPRTLQRRLGDDATSFRAEIQRARIEAARVRLATSDEKVEAIARGVGFSSSSHLARAFRAATGETPAGYRARNR